MNLGYAIWIKLKATDSGEFCRVDSGYRASLWPGETPQDAVEQLAAKYPGVYDETDTFIVRTDAGCNGRGPLVIVKLERAGFRAVVQS